MACLNGQLATSCLHVVNILALHKPHPTYARTRALTDGNTWNHEHIATLGRCLSAPEEDAHQLVRHLADYVLVWAGGGGDDLAKSPHMARIGGSLLRVTRNTSPSALYVLTFIALFKAVSNVCLCCLLIPFQISVHCTTGTHHLTTLSILSHLPARKQRQLTTLSMHSHHPARAKATLCTTTFAPTTRRAARSVLRTMRL
jgi:hypothetical protein